MNALTVGSLFSGIGGIDLGLERAGMQSRWFVEWDAHCQSVLRRHWPGLPVYGDITAVDWSAVEPVNVLAGGFPCQPISSAGKRLAQEDERWLWPEFAKAIRILRPRYVLVENVRNLLAVNGGSAFSEVLGDLAALGYDAEWDCIPASAVGAPHRRDRLWTVAYSSRVQPGRTEQRPERQRAGTGSQPFDVAHTEEYGRGSRGTGRSDSGRAGESEQPLPTMAYPPSLRLAGQGQPVESIYPAPNPYRQAGEPLDGRLAQQWVVEPRLGRVANGIPDRVERLRALGNAVVPQVVEWIGRRIVAFDEEMT